MKQGFTLIELLVVVLIIGILTSIAVPQYEKAVMRARFSGALQVAESLKKAHEIYFLANNHYIANTDNLDYDFHGSCTGMDVLKCDNYFYIDNLSGSGVVTDPNSWKMAVYSCPGAATWSACGTQADFIYTIWLDNSPHPNLRECNGITQKGKDFCLMIAEQ